MSAALLFLRTVILSVAKRRPQMTIRMRSRPLARLEIVRASEATERVKAAGANEQSREPRQGLIGFDALRRHWQ
jgi:hypothetical protein